MPPAAGNLRGGSERVYAKRKGKMKKHLKTPTKIVGKRRHGFLKKMSSRGGRHVLSRRRGKGRKRLAL